MADTGCPEQDPAEADTLNGEVTVLPFRGLATLMPPEEEVAEEVAELTVTATSATQTAPPLPHDLTWMVWPPAAAETDFWRYAPLTTAV